MDQERRKPGTVPRGERAAVLSRVPVDQHRIYEQRAEELGIPLGSWAAIKLAEAEGLDIPDYILEELRRAQARRDIESEIPPMARAG